PTSRSASGSRSLVGTAAVPLDRGAGIDVDRRGSLSAYIAGSGIEWLGCAGSGQYRARVEVDRDRGVDHRTREVPGGAERVVKIEVRLRRGDVQRSGRCPAAHSVRKYLARREAH